MLPNLILNSYKVCRTYLHESLQKVVKDVIDNSDEIDCEVDKERIQNGSVLKDNQDQLLRTAFNAITRLKQQKTFFPNELREVYVSLSSSMCLKLIKWPI